MIDHQNGNIMELQGNGPKPLLLTKTVTWTKDTHSLFDYEFTKNIVKEQMKILLQPGFIFMYRKNEKSQIILSRQTEMKQKNFSDQLLGCFQIMGNIKKFRLQFHQPSQFDQPIPQAIVEKTPDNRENDEKKLPKLQKIFFIVRSLKDSNNEPKGYKLKSGQFLKFGRIEYSVIAKGILDGNSSKKTFEEQYFDYEETITADDIEIQQGYSCKICLSNEEYPGGYFFCRPCSCSGSVSLIHFQCLYLWCETKIKKENLGMVTQYNFNKFHCEICKLPYPRYVEKCGVRYDLMPIKKPSGAYLSLLQNKQSSLEKKLLIIDYKDNKELKIGRNHECEIKINDISISRKHGKIEMKNNNFYIFDTKSKFGTLVCQPDLYIDLEMIKRGIQIGRTVATFELRTNLSE